MPLSASPDASDPSPDEFGVSLRQVAELSGVGGWRYRPGDDNLVWNAQTRRILEVGPDFRTNLDICLGFLSFENRVTLRDVLAGCIEQGVAFEIDLPVLTAKGRRRVVRVLGEPALESGGGVAVCGAVQDVTELRAREAALRQAEKEAEEARQRLWSAIETFPDGFVIYDSEDRLVVANRRYREMYARAAPAMKPRANFESIVRFGLLNGQYPAAAGQEAAWIRRRLERHRNPTGAFFEEELPGEHFVRVFEQRLENGDLVGLRVDITEQKRAQRRLEARSRLLEVSHQLSEERNRALEAVNAEIQRHADHDALTGLVNRRRFDEALPLLAGQASELGKRLAVLHIDLDWFKEVNDTYGHAAGDAVLTTAAERMARQLRRGDLLARLGGDEFVAALVVGEQEAPVRRIAERIIAALSEPIAVEAGVCAIGASIGAVLARPTVSIKTILEWSDIALYTAKESGRRQVVFFSEEVQSRHRQESECLSALRQAVEASELPLLYEPLIDARTREVVAEMVGPWIGGVPCCPGGLDEGDRRFAGLFERPFSEAGALRGRLQRRVADQAFAILRSGSDGVPAAPVILRLSPATLEQAAPFLDRDRLDDVVIAFREAEAAQFSDVAAARLDALVEAGARIMIRDFGAVGGAALPLARWRPAFVALAERLTGRPQEHDAALRLLLDVIQSCDAMSVALNVGSVEQADRLRALGCQAMAGPGVSAAPDAARRKALA